LSEGWDVEDGGFVTLGFNEELDDGGFDRLQTRKRGWISEVVRTREG
jgi:hypothetical protein